MDCHDRRAREPEASSYFSPRGFACGVFVSAELQLSRRSRRPSPRTPRAKRSSTSPQTPPSARALGSSVSARNQRTIAARGTATTEARSAEPYHSPSPAAMHAVVSPFSLSLPKRGKPSSEPPSATPTPTPRCLSHVDDPCEPTSTAPMNHRCVGSCRIQGIRCRSPSHAHVGPHPQRAHPIVARRPLSTEPSSSATGRR